MHVDSFKETNKSNYPAGRSISDPSAASHYRDERGGDGGQRGTDGRARAALPDSERPVVFISGGQRQRGAAIDSGRRVTLPSAPRDSFFIMFNSTGHAHTDMRQLKMLRVTPVG